MQVDESPTGPYKVLTEREARIVEALAETFFPPEAPDQPTVQEVDVVGYVDDLLAAQRPRDRVLMRAMFALFEVHPMVTPGALPRRFSRAPVEVRAQRLRAWERSSFYPSRMAFLALRGVMLWAYVDSPATRERLGIEPGTAITTRRQQQAALQRAEQAAQAERQRQQAASSTPAVRPVALEG